jgi:3-phenylpropionate/trans-cinnamate dioxygenase ferredoxin reductase subunit
MPERIVIVGAGHAGFNVVDALRREGFDGEIVLIGDEPHLPYQRPPLSKAFLTGEYDLERLLLRPAGFYEDNRVTLRLGDPAVAVDPEAASVTLRSGETITYDKLVLATGSRMRRLDVPGHDLAGVRYLRTHDDAAQLLAGLGEARSVAVIGGGFIGLEVSATARKLGRDVAVLEAADRLMARAVPPLVSEFFADYHRGKGVDLHLSAAVEGIEGDGRVQGVRTGGTRIDADLVVIGIGVLPATELAEAAGIACDNGILVDGLARTSTANIWAVGDCTHHDNGWADARLRLESVQHATDQARTAAAAMMGGAEPYRAVPWFWSDQYDLKLQIAGVADNHDDQIFRGEPKSGQFSTFHYMGDALRAVYSVNRPGDHMAARRLLALGRTLPRDVVADPAADLKPYLR